MNDQTHYFRDRDTFHVVRGHTSTGFTYAGVIVAHRPGFCVCCEEPSKWPLCPWCHDVVLDVPSVREGG